MMIMYRPTQYCTHENHNLIVEYLSSHVACRVRLNQCCTTNTAPLNKDSYLLQCPCITYAYELSQSIKLTFELAASVISMAVTLVCIRAANAT